MTCSFCGHATHGTDCPRTITTRHGDRPCPCTRHTQGARP